MGDDLAPPRFVSEPITPVPDSLMIGRMAAGEPGLPGRFTWRGGEFEIAEVVESRKGYGTDGHVPHGETYLRKHWFMVRTETGEVMRIYCERQARSRGKPKARWWLYTIQDANVRA